MKHIIVVGDLSSTNLGDPLLTHCCHYIVSNVLRDSMLPVELFDIAGRKPAVNSDTPIFLKTSSRRTGKTELLKDSIIPIVKWFLKEKKIFHDRLLGAGVEDAIFIIAGGALISSSLFYALRLNEIVKTAKKHNGKVVFNSVGIEKSVYDVCLAKYIVRHFLRQKEVVAFSTRDHVDDIPYLTNRKEFYKRTPDPGLFADEAYGIKKKESTLIGLSVISYQAYQSIAQNDKRAKSVTADYLISYWGAIINHLQQLKVGFRILTNGGKADYDMALKLVHALKLDENKYLLPIPRNPLELVEQLSMFRLVIAHRLHACIISTSLSIPIIPIIWSDKVKVFAEMIGNRFATWPEAEDLSQLKRAIDDCLNDHVDTSHFKNEITDYISNSIILAKQ